MTRTREPETTYTLERRQVPAPRCNVLTEAGPNQLERRQAAVPRCTVWLRRVPIHSRSWTDSRDVPSLYLFFRKQDDPRAVHISWSRGREPTHVSLGTLRGVRQTAAECHLPVGYEARRERDPNPHAPDPTPA